VKKLILIVLILGAVVGGVWIYLVSTTPAQSAGVRFPLTGSQRALIANVPATADAFALVPTVAAVQVKLLANPATHDVVDRWVNEQNLPPSWVLGGADVVAWRSGKQTSYLVRLDPIRAVIARTVLMISGDTGARVMINVPQEAPMAAADLDPLLALANGLPPGDALVVRRENARGAFPPIGRPTASSIRITPEAIDVVSRGNGGQAPSPVQNGQAGVPVLHPRYSRTAILTTTFTAPPRLIDDMNRLIGAKASTLLRDGGTIVLYDVETGKLLPRPREVIVLPATPERRVALDEFVRNAIPNEIRDIVGLRIETGEAPGELLVSFDKHSIDQYLKDTFDAPSLPGGSLWALRLDPKRAVPMLEQISDNPGLRYITPRIFRSSKDLQAWVTNLQNARSIEAAASATASGEELRVHIATK
jgi:hypothetical protein